MIFPKKEEKVLTYGLTSKEFRCRCKYEECRAVIVNHRLLKAYEKLRRALGCPCMITSGHRCTRHNHAVGGSACSRHILGQAIDILYTTAIANKMSLQAFGDLARQCGFTYVKLYQGKNKRIHADVRR